jgi:Co/Zn/Cd efflux system component
MTSCCGASDCSAASGTEPRIDRVYRRVLWVALAINVAMFAIEVVAGAAASSVSLWADSADFAMDAANYGISLAVLGMVPRRRARAALIKGVSLGAIGLWVAGSTLANAFSETVPEAGVMGAVGFAALLANLACAAMLYVHRAGDANRRSVWLCSRNDAICNVAVMLAASGVWASGTGWPDVAVAAIMATLSLSAALHIVRQARRELPPAPLGVAAE